MADPQEYQRRVAAAVMQAIFDVSTVDQDGVETAYASGVDVVAALINVMAIMLEGVAGCDTPKSLRESPDGVGRKMLVQLREMRAITAETGKPAFDTIYTRPN